MHILRSKMLAEGKRWGEVTAEISDKLGVKATILLMMSNSRAEMRTSARRAAASVSRNILCSAGIKIL